MSSSTAVLQDTKKIFRTCGACSHTFFYILNREFGYPKEAEERASNPLAGGMMCGQQCGMLWGAALAVGAESFRRYDDRGQAMATAIMATQSLMESYSKRAKSVNCRDVIGCDLSSKLGMMRLMLQIVLHGGLNNSLCFNLADAWAPEAIQAAAEGLSHELPDLSQPPLSCASEVARKMGASDEEMVMVAGFAGGMGLSGNACGALGAAIWMNTLAWCKKHPGENPPISKNYTAKIFNAFYDATGSEMFCHKIAGQRFKTINDHTEFIKCGGCAKVIHALAMEGI